jgi:hypothetical protein
MLQKKLKNELSKIVQETFIWSFKGAFTKYIRISGGEGVSDLLRSSVKI